MRNSIQKVVLVGIYDTSAISLAPQILKSYAEPFPVAKDFLIQTRDFSIFSHTIDQIVSEIRSLKPDIVGFSTYVWNHLQVLQVAERLDCTVVLGGPQVTDIEESLLHGHHGVDIVISGEGEQAFIELLEYFAGRRELSSVSGAFQPEGRSADKSFLNDLDSIPSPYQRMLQNNKSMTWISYESSRGCPMGCKYCTWSNSRKMRYYSLNRVKEDLTTILAHPSLKDLYFCDSSLLFDKRRAKEILHFLISQKSSVKIRFEFSAEQLDDELIDLLASLPNDEFNFGLQTIEPEALKQIGRRFDEKLFLENYRKLADKLQNDRLTIDLIYGLPGDTAEGFLRSLEFALQLPKLKRILSNPLIALPGSELYRKRQEYGIKLVNDSDYLVRSSNTFSEDDMALARKYSFYVAVIQLNDLFRDSLIRYARNKNARVVDTLNQVMEALPKHIMPLSPDMIPTSIAGFQARNRAMGTVVQNFQEIVEKFSEVSNMPVDGYQAAFTESYEKARKFSDL